jgi:hypothetical protein
VLKQTLVCKHRFKSHGLKIGADGFVPPNRGFTQAVESSVELIYTLCAIRKTGRLKDVNWGLRFGRGVKKCGYDVQLNAVYAQYGHQNEEDFNGHSAGHGGVQVLCSPVVCALKIAADHPACSVSYLVAVFVEFLIKNPFA